MERERYHRYLLFLLNVFVIGRLNLVMNLIDSVFEHILNIQFELSHLIYWIVLLVIVIFPVIVLIGTYLKLNSIISSRDRLNVIINKHVLVHFIYVIEEDDKEQGYEHANAANYQTNVLLFKVMMPIYNARCLQIEERFLVACRFQAVVVSEIFEDLKLFLIIIKRNHASVPFLLL